MSTIATAQRVVRLLFRAPANLANGGTFNQPKINLIGYSRLRGQYHMAAGMAPAAGFPRIRFSADGTNFDVTRQLVADATQLPEVVFPIDEVILFPYVAIELTNGVVAGNVSAQISALPEA